MNVADLLPETKLHARIDGDDEDAALALMLAAAVADVLAAAARPEPDDADELPDDLRFAVIDQATMLFDARGGVTDRPVGLSLAASRIVARYRGVSLGATESAQEGGGDG